MEIMTSSNTPKLSLTSLEIRNNYYVVPSGGRFHYFPIKIDESTINNPVIRFEKSPPLLIDGLVIFNKRVYEVTSQDILRLRILRSRELIAERDTYGSSTNYSNGDINQPVGQADTSTSNQPVTTDSSPGHPISSKDKSGSLQDAVLEIDQVIDAAWEEQIDSLLCLISSKEGGEWEITDVAQP